MFGFLFRMIHVISPKGFNCFWVLVSSLNSLLTMDTWRLYNASGLKSWKTESDKNRDVNANQLKREDNKISTDGDKEHVWVWTTKNEEAVFKGY